MHSHHASGTRSSSSVNNGQAADGESISPTLKILILQERSRLAVEILRF